MGAQRLSEKGAATREHSQMTPQPAVSTAIRRRLPPFEIRNLKPPVGPGLAPASHLHDIPPGEPVVVAKLAPDHFCRDSHRFSSVEFYGEPPKLGVREMTHQAAQGGSGQESGKTFNLLL